MKPLLQILLQTLIAALVVLMFSSCTVVRQGEVGVKRKVGKLQQEIYPAGAVAFNPFTTRVLKLSTQSENMEVQLDFPSKEGLTIRSGISILYRIKPDAHRLSWIRLGRNTST